MKKRRNYKSVNRRKVIFIVIFWSIVGVLQTFYDHFLIGSHLTNGYATDYIFLKTLIANTLAGFIGGVIGSYLLVFVVNKKYRSAPYYKGILIVCIVFVFTILFITVSLATLQVTILHGGFRSQTGMEAFNNLLYSTELIKNTIFWAFVVAFTQLGLHINDKFGQGLFWSMITGKYHLPTSEERIFMFLDLKGSTAIAEKLGNKKYHHFLKDVFSDITNPILANFGQIYQYVGDEVVISWPQENNRFDNRCIKCFFDVKEKLNSLNQKYKKRYNVKPIFKAGIHNGKIIAGEVGIIKRDITFSGDTLNTAARIQCMCNENRAELLISESLAELLHPSTFTLTSLGKRILRGKQENMELFVVKKEDNQINIPRTHKQAS